MYSEVLMVVTSTTNYGRLCNKEMLINVAKAPKKYRYIAILHPLHVCEEYARTEHKESNRNILERIVCSNIVEFLSRIIELK